MNRRAVLAVAVVFALIGARLLVTHKIHPVLAAHYGAQPATTSPLQTQPTAAVEEASAAPVAEEGPAAEPVSEAAPAAQPRSSAHDSCDRIGRRRERH